MFADQLEPRGEVMPSHQGRFSYSLTTTPFAVSCPTGSAGRHVVSKSHEGRMTGYAQLAFLFAVVLSAGAQGTSALREAAALDTPSQGM